MDSGCPLYPAGGETLMSKLTRDCFIRFAPIKNKINYHISVAFLAAATQRSLKEKVRLGRQLQPVCAISKPAIYTLTFKILLK